MQTHKEKLTEKTRELKKSGMEYIDIVDSVYHYHEQEMLFGNTAAKIEFNRECGLSDYSHPDKSGATIWDIVDEVIETPPISNICPDCKEAGAGSCLNCGGIPV